MKYIGRHTDNIEAIAILELHEAERHDSSYPKEKDFVSQVAPDDGRMTGGLLEHQLRGEASSGSGHPRSAMGLRSKPRMRRHDTS